MRYLLCTLGLISLVGPGLFLLSAYQISAQLPDAPVPTNDARGAPRKTEIALTTGPVTSPQNDAPTVEPAQQFDLDVAANEVEFSRADLEYLLMTGRTEIALPDGYVHEFTLNQHRARNSMGWVSVANGTLVGTITYGEHGFFATLPTPGGTFRLQNAGGATTAVSHRALDLRTNRHAQDFRYAP